MLLDYRNIDSLAVTLNCGAVLGNSVIYWGDGTTGDFDQNIHNYPKHGIYHLSIHVNAGKNISLGTGSGKNVLGQQTNPRAKFSTALRGLLVGMRVNLMSYCFQKLYGLDWVSLAKDLAQDNWLYRFSDNPQLGFVGLPRTWTVLPSQTFYYDFGLWGVSLPDTITQFGTTCCSGCYSLRFCQPPKGCNIGTTAFANDRRLEKFYYTNSNGVVQNSSFSYCYSLCKIVIDADSIAFNQQAFYQAAGLSELIIKNGNVTAIQAQAFSSCQSLYVIDLRKNTTIPTLANINAFSSMPSTYKIIVPDALYADWIAATNWSNTSVVSHIVKASDYTD